MDDGWSWAAFKMTREERDRDSPVGKRGEGEEEEEEELTCRMLLRDCTRVGGGCARPAESMRVGAAQAEAEWAGPCEGGQG